MKTNLLCTEIIHIYSNSWLSIFSTGSWERNRIGEREVSRKLPQIDF